MKPSLSLLLALLLMATLADASTDTGQEDREAWIKTVVARDWVASANTDSGDIQLQSPIYPMRFKQGCVIHRLTFLAEFRQPALDHLVTEARYYAFASGEACAAVDPAHFFEIHAGSDTFGVMDFARRLKAGPQAGRDTLSKHDAARVRACFLPDAMRSTRITRASSRRVGGERREEFRVVLACEGLMDGEEIHAIGSYKKDETTRWEISSLAAVDAAP